MEGDALALLIDDNPANGALIRRTLSGEARLRLQCVERVATALARIAGGGVNVVILDESSSKTPEIEILDNLLTLRSAAPQTPIIVVCDAIQDGLVMRAIRAGTADYLARERCVTDLCPMVYSALERGHAQTESPIQRTPEARKRARIVTLLGGKGGVGTTTVALNLATALAQTKSVILAELQPAFGTLSQYFHPHPGVRNLAQLLKVDPSAICPVEAAECLWRYKNVPGLDMIFGPGTFEQCREIGRDHARAIPRALSALADYVVLDLPASLSEANRAILEDSDLAVLVIERDPFSMEAGKRMVESIRNWNSAPPLAGSVIVNRTALATPTVLAEIEMQLAMPILAVIPPAPDLCIAAQKAGAPLVVFDPDSLGARSLTALAEKIASRR